MSNAADIAIVRRLSMSANPVKFAQELGFDHLDPWQRDLLLAADRQIILNCSRQSGKTTLVAILALDHALTRANALVLVLSPSQRQSGELFRKITRFYSDSGRPVKAEQETVLTLTLHNGSRIVTLPSKEATVRGFSAPSLVIIDEAARADDELYYGAIRPMLSVSNGRLILLSTPAGQRGFYHKTWTEEDGWRRFKVTADEVPRIDADFLLQEEKELGEHYFRQEYMGEFFARDDAVFDPALIKAAFRGDFNEWDLDLDSDLDAATEMGGPPDEEKEEPAQTAKGWHDLDLDSDSKSDLNTFSKGD